MMIAKILILALKPLNCSVINFDDNLTSLYKQVAL